MRSMIYRSIFCTPPKFNSSPLKKGGWKTHLSSWGSVTFQGRTVKLREGVCMVYLPDNVPIKIQPKVVGKYTVRPNGSRHG